jgi:hypothetical protein
MKLFPFFAAAALTLAATPAQASVTADLDTKLITYKNDGDGMGYVIVNGKRQSLYFDEILRYPLDKDNTPRYTTDDQAKRRIPHAQPGAAGQQYQRPLADGEIAQISQSTLVITETVGSGALALDPNADPGPVMDSFDALVGKADCKITIYEKATDICGQKFGRAGIVNWTMFTDRYCSYYGFCYRENYDFTVGYQSREGRKATSFRFVNGKAAQRFIQVFSAWGGSSPQRI